MSDDRDKMQNINTLSNIVLRELGEYWNASAKIGMPPDPKFMDGFRLGVRALSDLFIICSEAGRVVYLKDEKRLKQLDDDWVAK